METEKESQEWTETESDSTFSASLIIFGMCFVFLILFGSVFSFIGLGIFILIGLGILVFLKDSIKVLTPPKSNFGKVKAFIFVPLIVIGFILLMTTFFVSIPILPIFLGLAVIFCFFITDDEFFTFLGIAILIFVILNIFPIGPVVLPGSFFGMDPASTFIWFERLFWGFLIIAGIFVLIAVLSPNNRQTYLKGAISFFVLAIISIAIMKLISLGDLSY